MMWWGRLERREEGEGESKHAGVSLSLLILASVSVRTLEEVVVDGQAVLLGDEL